jgi:hypothetical protein
MSRAAHRRATWPEYHWSAVAGVWSELFAATLAWD